MTSISIIFPLVYIVGQFVPETVFVVLLHIMLPVVAFLFVLDFSVKKPNWKKILTGK